MNNSETGRPQASVSSSARQQPQQPYYTQNGASSQLSDEQNQNLIQMAGYLFGAVIMLRVLSSFFYLIIFGPILYLYMAQTCPSQASFDARKELKRVMRGHHLPDNHPDKPKGFFEETIARAVASVTTEVATSLGYEIGMCSAGNAAHLVWVRVPAAKMDYYWIGAFSRWTYVYSTEIPGDGKNKTD